MVLWICTVCLVRLKCLICACVNSGGSCFSRPSDLSRLSEISSTCPFLPARAVAQAMSSSFKQEHVSPKRECVTAPLFLFSSPRLGEGSLPERETLSLERDFSAWARGWARMHQVLFSLLFWYDYYIVGWFGLFKTWEAWCVCMGLVHGFNMMSWLWRWYEIWRDWWIINDDPWHGIVMRNNSIFIVWEWCVGMNFTCDSNEDAL